MRREQDAVCVEALWWCGACGLAVGMFVWIGDVRVSKLPC